MGGDGGGEGRSEIGGLKTRHVLCRTFILASAFLVQ